MMWSPVSMNTLYHTMMALTPTIADRRNGGEFSAGRITESGTTLPWRPWRDQVGSTTSPMSPTIPSQKIWQQKMPSLSGISWENIQEIYIKGENSIQVRLPEGTSFHWWSQWGFLKLHRGWESRRLGNVYQHAIQF